MKSAAWLAVAVTVCGLAYDPGAYAADPKRALFALLGCACVTTALVMTRSGRARPRRMPRALLAALAFVALSALSLLWGPAPGALDLSTWIAGVGVALLVTRMRRISAVACARLASLWLGGISGVVTLGSALLGARGFALHAGQGNPNWLGLLLAVTLPVAADTCILHIKRSAISRRNGLLSVLLCLVQVPALYLSHSRVAWVACGAAIALVVALSVRGWRRRVAQASAAAILALGLLSSHAAQAEERDAFSNDVPAAQSLRGRVAIWKNSVVAARDAAPFGAGLGSFAHAFHDAQGHGLSKLTPNAAARAYTNATTAHEEYVQTAVESGVLCAAALVAALLLGMAATARARFFGGSGALVACAVAALGDSPLRQPAVVLVVALVLGTLRGSRQSAPRDPRRGKKVDRRPWHRFALAALLLASAGSFTRSTRAWLGTHAYLASFAADPDVRMKMLARSERLDPNAGEPHFERGLLLLSAGDPRAALGELTLASERMTDTGIFCARGEAHIALEQEIDAEADYRDALAWNPGSLRARVGLASSLHRQGKNEEAEANAKIAKKLSPGAPEVRDLLDSIRESRADEDH